MCKYRAIWQVVCIFLMGFIVLRLARDLQAMWIALITLGICAAAAICVLFGASNRKLNIGEILFLATLCVGLVLVGMKII
jgi:hypothetical protein